MTETDDKKGAGGGSAGKRPKNEHKMLRKVPFIGGRIADRLENAPIVPVLRLTGVIGEAGRFRKGGLTLADLAGPIDQAFSFPQAKAVALVINSPGGSPVQSDLIAKRIRLVAAEKKLPVIAFCEDAAASGGYWLACAADEIYAADASVVGSIGVISAGFGFTGLIDKIGVERRVYTAGEQKSQLDPFQPENAEDIKRLLALQADIHDQFREWIRSRRGERLQGDDSALFTGEFWTGRQALKLGLVDGLGEIRTIAREKYGENVKLPVVTPPKSWLQRRLGIDSLQSRLSADGIAEAVVSGAEERAWWARLGL